MGHRFGQIHVFAAADFEHRVARNHVFFERGESDGRLDGGARNRAGGISHFLVDDGEDAAGGRLDCHDGPIVFAKRINGGSADNRIVKIGDIAERGIDSFFARHITMARGANTRLCSGSSAGRRNRRRKHTTSGED